MSTPALDFHCYRCRKDTDTAPEPPAVAVCEECCHETSGHDYEYVREERGHLCVNCGARRPDDWDDD